VDRQRLTCLGEVGTRQKNGPLRGEMREVIGGRSKKRKGKLRGGPQRRNPEESGFKKCSPHGGLRSYTGRSLINDNNKKKRPWARGKKSNLGGPIVLLLRAKEGDKQHDQKGRRGLKGKKTRSALGKYQGRFVLMKHHQIKSFEKE